MSHHTRTRADLAAWGSGAVSPTEFDKLDGNGFKSVNGDDGGVWAPSSVIEFGGDGLLVSGPFESTGGAQFDAATVEALTVGSTATFNGNTILGNSSADTLEVNATTVFDSSVEFNDPTQFDDTATYTADVVIGLTLTDTLEVNSSAVFDSPVEFNDPVQFDDDVVFNDLVDLNGAQVEIGNSTVLHFGTSARITGSPTLGVRMLFDDVGRVPLRFSTLTASSQTVLVAQGNVFAIALAGTNRTYSLLDADGAAGDFMIFANNSSGGGAADVIIDMESNPSVTLAAGGGVAGLFVRSSSAWFHCNFI